MCDDKCALFVPLDRLSPPSPRSSPLRSLQQQSPTHMPIIQTLDNSLQATPLPKPRFQLNDRVYVHNKYGQSAHGKVKWTDSVVDAGQSYIAVGIRLVSFLTSHCSAIYYNYS